VIGTVSPDRSVKEVRSSDFGNDLDLKLYNEMVLLGKSRARRRGKACAAAMVTSSHGSCTTAVMMPLRGSVNASVRGAMHARMAVLFRLETENTRCKDP
jgi:hypothetical protein